MSFTQYLREADAVKSVVKPVDQWKIVAEKAMKNFIDDLTKQLKGKEVEIKLLDNNLVKRLKVKNIDMASDTKYIESNGEGIVIVDDQDKIYKFDSEFGIHIL